MTTSIASSGEESGRDATHDRWQYQRRTQFEFIRRHLAGQPGAVLDLGCGPGYITDYLRSLGVNATGIDMVPEFVAHARAAYPSGSCQLGSFENLSAADHSIAGILAWGSLIHLPSQELDRVLAEFRRVMAPAGTLVLAIFVGDEVAAFEHKVVTAYRWPADELSQPLAQAGFTEVERLQRPTEGTCRPHAAIAAIAPKGELSQRASVQSRRHDRAS